MVASESAPSRLLDGDSPILKNEKASSILMGMIRQEMVHQLMRANKSPNALDEDEIEEDYDDDDSDAMSDLESQAYTEVSEIAEAMFNAVDTESLAESVASGNFDQLDEKQLRSLLQSTLNDSKHVQSNRKASMNTLSTAPDSDLEPSSGSAQHDFKLQKQDSKSAIETLLEGFAKLDYDDEDEDESDYGEDDDDDLSCISDLTGLTSTGIDTKPRRLPTYTSAVGSNGSVTRDDESRNSGQSGQSSGKMIIIEGLPKEFSSVGGSTTNNRSATKSRRKKVRFGNVGIRYYTQIVCDNPGLTTGGPSIGFGWEFRESLKKRTVSEFEKERNHLRLHSKALILTKEEREFLIKKWGIEPIFIKQMARSVQKTKAHRRQTANNLGAQKVEEAVERVGRRFRTMFKR